jgi:hypothetical protein
LASLAAPERGAQDGLAGGVPPFPPPDYPLHDPLSHSPPLWHSSTMATKYGNRAPTRSCLRRVDGPSKRFPFRPSTQAFPYPQTGRSFRSHHRIRALFPPPHGLLFASGSPHPPAASLACSSSRFHHYLEFPVSIGSRYRGIDAALALLRRTTLRIKTDPWLGLL